MIGPDINESGVAPLIIDAIGIGAGNRRIGKIMPLDALRSILPEPLLAFISKVSNQFLLLGVHRNDWPSLGYCSAHLAVDVLELSIPIWMILPLLSLAVALQAVAHVPKELGHFLVADRMPTKRQFSSQRSGALAGPAQWRFRIASRQRFNQSF